MELSELQELIMLGLQICELERDDIIAVMLLLETEQLQWEMAEYLDTVVDNPPDRTIVFKKAVEIAGLLEKE